MKIAFVSNFYNHHQKPLADAMHSMIGNDYYFIETSPITKERLAMGWGKEEKPDYVLQSYQSPEMRVFCQRIVDTADVVIFGSAPYQMFRSRLQKGLLTFLYTERLYREGTPYINLPIHFLRSLKNYLRFKNFYVLCASAFTPLDFSRTFAFIGKTYKWGYFTELKKYENTDELIEKKQAASLLWVGRFIPCKCTEKAIQAAKLLSDNGYDFTMNIIGNGALEENIKILIESHGLSDKIKMLGAMTPQQVREHMEKSEIFIFTSNREEGWGAVLNESMNSACAVVANSEIGAVPFLLEDGQNGYIYKKGDVNDLYSKVKFLLDNPDERKRVSKNAYHTMLNEWNADTAAKKFISLCEKMLSGEYKPFPYESGVCSKAKILKDNWYKK